MEIETKIFEDFVHQWFSDLDELKETELFLHRLDKHFEFDIYGTKLQGHQGFISIYESMLVQNNKKAKHIASNIMVKQIDKQLFEICFDIALEEKNPDGIIKFRSESIEKWLIQKKTKQLIILKYAIIKK
ncbi:hypothetical protein [Tenacibaculum amylolyticum]|uniref:hypothetical protein n=1 Tax=Tenacibaculum amylolyticum TaxID=104269 RepID=UPI003893339F